MVLKSTHEEVLAKLRNLKKMESDLYETIDLIGNLNDIRMVNFSDSFIIFSKDDSISCFYNFLIMVRGFFMCILEEGLCVKSGIAYGKLTVQQNANIFFGQPLIDAYLIEEDVNYLGAVCHHSIQKYLRKNKLENDQRIENVLTTLTTPLKSGLIKHLNLLWFEMHHSKLPFENTSKLLEDLYYTVSGSPRRYLDNTEKVINEYFAKKKTSD